MGKTLMIGSCEPYSGKSALVLGIARHLKSANKSVRYGKPLATSLESEGQNNALDGLFDDDVRFVANTLRFKDDQLIPSIEKLSAYSSDQRLLHQNLVSEEGLKALSKKLNEPFDGLNILEAAGSLHEGLLYGLNLGQIARALDIKVLLVHLWQDSCSVDHLLAAKQELGEHLLGVVLNAVNPDEVSVLKENVVPSLNSLGFNLYGVMPRSPLLRSVTVEELVRRLGARVVCCQENLGLMVETLSIGAMSVNSAMEFFRQSRNMAVVTGADRTDIQLAALEASTQCLILTGAGEPLPQLISRSEELEVPLLKVDTDTLSTVEVIEQAFGHVRLHEAVKANYAFRLVEENCDLNLLFETLEINLKSHDSC